MGYIALSIFIVVVQVVYWGTRVSVSLVASRVTGLFTYSLDFTWHILVYWW